jgi:uncharacterized membrane protein
VAVAILALVLADRMLCAGRSRGACLLVIALAAANPVSIRALELGHPEELLTAALAIGAVLAAARERALLAAVLLGLAIASKAWAVLAIGPVLLALPGRRVLALAIAGAVCAIMLAWSLPLATWLARELFVPGLALPRRRRTARTAWA